ncbi:restriction endonuclease subunit S [Planococcus soli]|uniref:restriction endonuclease subunit S n=1 Tax=Planococcus soli TaxID=2666072 RepID=UPI00115ED116|nr:restriction endonuclease subunit S [Planococcus soli]
MKLLNELCEINIGKTPSRSEKRFWGTGYKWLSIADMKSKYISKSKEEITDSAVEECNMKIIPKDTVIMSFKLSIGKLGIVKEDFFSNEAIASFVVKQPTDLLPEYLYLALSTVNLDKYTDKAVKGKTLNKRKLNKIEIPYTDIDTQRKIVKFMNQCVEIIEKRQSQIVALDELVKSTFLEMFGDPKENKNQYPVRPLFDFYESQKDGVKCGPFGSALKKDEYTNSGIPVWNMDNITKSNSFIDQPNLFVSEKKAIQLKGYNVQNGDIIISRAGTVGKMGVVRSKYENSLISTNLVRLRLNNELIPEFLVILIRIFGDKVCRMRTGSEGSFTHMNTSVLNSMEFPVPPLEKQKQFIKFLEEIGEQNLKFIAALNEMQFLYNSLLQKAFRGELNQEK